MKHGARALALLVLTASALAAQTPGAGRPPADTARGDTVWNTAPAGGQGGLADGPQDPMRAAMLRAQVEKRFDSMVQADLQLNEQDMQRVRTAVQASQDRRLALVRREQDLRLAMARQMQRGVAANADSVNRMTEAMSHLRLERAQSDDQLVRDLGFLQPVKRARLLFMMQRFEQRVQEIRRRSLEGGPMRRPVMRRPGMRMR